MTFALIQIIYEDSVVFRVLDGLIVFVMWNTIIHRFLNNIVKQQSTTTSKTIYFRTPSSHLFDITKPSVQLSLERYPASIHIIDRCWCFQRASWLTFSFIANWFVLYIHVPIVVAFTFDVLYLDIESDLRCGFQLWLHCFTICFLLYYSFILNSDSRMTILFYTMSS